MAVRPRVRQSAPEAKRRPSVRLRTIIPYLILAAIMGLFAYTFLQKTRQIQALRLERAALQYNIQQTEQDNARQRQAIRDLQRPTYVEQEARTVLGYTMPGDVPIETQLTYAHPVYVRAAPAMPARPPAPVWQQWLSSFFG